MKIEEAMTKVRTGRYTLTYDGKLAGGSVYSVGTLENDRWGATSRPMPFMDALNELRAAPEGMCMYRNVGDETVYVILSGILNRVHEGRSTGETMLNVDDLFEEDWVVEELSR